MGSFKIFYWLLATGVLTVGLLPAAQALPERPDYRDDSRSAAGVGEAMLLVRSEVSIESDIPLETAASYDSEPGALLENNQEPGEDLLSPQLTGSAIALEERVREVTQSESAPITTLDEWRNRLAQAQVRITNVRLEETDAGLQIVLETVGGTPRISDPRTVGNALVSEISNAELDLPGGEDLEEFAPADGIALVRVSSLPGNLVQVSITGSDAVPQAQMGTEGRNLVLSVEPGVAVAADDGDAIQVLVTGEGNEGYAPSDSTTGTRTDTPLRDIPQSIQIVSDDVIEDQQLTRLDDALRNVSGVSQNSADPRGQRFQVRGFDGANVLRDGFQLVYGGIFGNSGFQELVNLERVEVLKGPAAILYGASQPGGVINLVTKTPLSEPFYELEFTAGNRNLIEPSIDLSGPLTADGRLLYRLNALYRREDYFRDFDTPVERFFIAPVLQWNISDRSDLLINLEYYHDRRPADLGLIAIGDGVADIPFDRNLGEPEDELTAESVRATYRFEHRFSDRWKLNNAFSFYTYNTVFQPNNPLGFDEETGILERTFTEQDSPTTNYEVQLNTTGEFNTGSIKHRLLAGIDYQHRFGPSTERGRDPDGFTSINIFDPVYGQVPRPDPDDLPLSFDGDLQQNRLGVFIQDQIEVLDNLKVLLGVRYDAVWQDTLFRPASLTPDGANSSLFIDDVSPRIGIVYQPTDELSLYGSFSRSFFPNTAFTAGGDLLPPQRGEQFEIGVRGEFLDGRLIGNLALFNLTRQNLPTSDPDNPRFSLAVGEQRSRGIELDIAGEILPGWNIIANYAYLDAEIIEDDDLPEGNRLFNVPEHSFNLWTNYEIQKGDLQGLGFGLGFNYISERFGDNTNSFTLDSYFLTNAAISYKRNNWKAALNFRNVFDVDYIQGNEGRRNSEIYPGQEFTIVGSISVEF